MSYALETIDLTKSFGRTPAVYQIQLQVEPGQFVTLLGPSGCGKTTTLRLIAGFEEPDSGTIRIDQKIVADDRTFIPTERRNVGMVFQEYAIFPHVNVRENVAFGLQGSRQQKTQRVQSLLELVGLEEYAERMPHELSGGQQQRVALARALAPQPAILLLDEPFSNLDTALRSQVRAEVRSILRQSNTTAIFVTHDQQEALSLSDQVAVLFDGRLVQMDSPRMLYTYPASEQVARFIGEANFLPAQANGIRANSALGELILRNPMQGDVNLLIRPEALFLGDEGVPVNVKWQEYYGHDQRIGIVLGDGTQLIARTDSDALVALGENARIKVVGSVIGFPLK